MQSNLNRVSSSREVVTRMQYLGINNLYRAYADPSGVVFFRRVKRESKRKTLRTHRCGK
jgi:hypothetical protein